MTEDDVGAAAVRPHLMVLIDDPTVERAVVDLLARSGFAVASTAPRAKLADQEVPEFGFTSAVAAIVVDADAATYESTFRELRDAAPSAAIVALRTPRSLAGPPLPDLGADDYVVKPFSGRELVARIDSVLQRRALAGDRRLATEDLEFGDLVISPGARTVARAGVPVGLTGREFALLLHLASSPGVVFSREQLLATVWGDSAPSDGSTVTVHIRRLRKKLELDPAAPRHVLTVWGAGYTFYGTAHEGDR